MFFTRKASPLEKMANDNSTSVIEIKQFKFGDNDSDTIVEINRWN